MERKDDGLDLEAKPKKKKKAGGAEFIGGNRYKSGIPARNLSVDEWNAIPEEVRGHLVKIGLYKEL